MIFTGFQFAEAYQEFRSNCYLYVQASEVGGTHPALIEAMVWGNCVVANDVPEHREVLEDCGMFYPKNDFSSLSLLLQRLVSEPETVRILGLKAKARAEEFYNWNLITKQYLDLFGEKTS